MSLLGSLPWAQEQSTGHLKIKKGKKQTLGRGAPEEQVGPSGKERERRDKEAGEEDTAYLEKLMKGQKADGKGDFDNSNGSDWELVAGQGDSTFGSKVWHGGLHSEPARQGFSGLETTTGGRKCGSFKHCYWTRAGVARQGQKQKKRQVIQGDQTQPKPEHLGLWIQGFSPLQLSFEKL